MEKGLLLFCLLFINTSGYAQLFNPFVEADLKLTQVDGDKLSGYHKLGYDIGLGMNTRIYKGLTFDAYVGYSRYGSKQKDIVNVGQPVDKLELDIRAASIHFGPRIEFNEKVSFKVFFQYQSIFSIRHKLNSRKFGVEKYEIENQSFDNNNMDIGGKIYFRLHPKHFLYAGFTRGIHNILTTRYPEFKAIVPFSICAGYRYTLYHYVSKTKKKRRRPAR